jgi:hypothetical protein
MPTRFDPVGHHVSKLSAAPTEPDDAQATWSRERLIAMDEKFCERMQRAIARGLERRPHGEAPERAA